jgi:nucleotide-binding universal stress UspA family protein
MVVRRSCIVSPREPIVDTKVSTSHPDSSKEIIAPILVGVDTRGRSTSAVVWAAEEADRAGRPLRLVTVNEGPDGSEDPQAAHGLVTLARRLTLAEVQHVALAGSPADVLLEEAARASLVVVGRRGLVPAKRLLVGGTSLVVSARSTVPVVVVPEPWIQPSLASAPVVVGVSAPDPTHEGDHDPARESEVLSFAFERASRLRVPLIVVSAWEIPALYSWSPADVAASRERYSEALERLIAPWREKHQDLEVVTRSVAEPPSHALVEASKVCQLVVVGQHLGPHLGRLNVGSTTGHVLDHATRPVAVVPLGLPAAPRRPADGPAWAPTF